MKKSGVIFLLTIITVVLAVLNGFVYINTDHTGPTIHLPSSNSGFAQNADTKTLLDGVTATDNRDGDVSSSLRVASVVPNADNTQASVVYTAKDKSNNVTKMTRVITYAAQQQDNTAAAAAGDAAAAANPSDTTATDSAAAAAAAPTSDATGVQSVVPSADASANAEEGQE